MVWEGGRGGHGAFVGPETVKVGLGASADFEPNNVAQGPVDASIGREDTEAPFCGYTQDRKVEHHGKKVTFSWLVSNH
jgi:hypothetical protein